MDRASKKEGASCALLPLALSFPLLALNREVYCPGGGLVTLVLPTGLPSIS